MGTGYQSKKLFPLSRWNPLIHSLVHPISLMVYNVMPSKYICIESKVIALNFTGQRLYYFRSEPVWDSDCLKRSNPMILRYREKHVRRFYRWRMNWIIIEVWLNHFRLFNNFLHICHPTFVIDIGGIFIPVCSTCFRIIEVLTLFFVDDFSITVKRIVGC